LNLIRCKNSAYSAKSGIIPNGLSKNNLHVFRGLEKVSFCPKSEVSRFENPVVFFKDTHPFNRKIIGFPPLQVECILLSVGA
jgi:hypothetical protein